MPADASTRTVRVVKTTGGWHEILVWFRDDTPGAQWVQQRIVLSPTELQGIKDGKTVIAAE